MTDPTSLEAIVADVLRLSGAKTNDEKAIALYDYAHATLFHCQCPAEAKPQSVGPLKAINVYGWGLCGSEHTLLKALFETAGWPARYRGWSNPGHSTVETLYDGRWHYLDVFLKCYFWTRDRKTLAGQDDILADPGIVLDALKDGRVPPRSYLCCGDSAEGVISGVRSSKADPGPSRPDQGWGSFTGRDRDYTPTLSLPAGASLRLEWANRPDMAAVPGRNAHSCGTKDYRSDSVLGPILEHYGPRAYANGAFVYAPDFSRPAEVAGVELAGARAEGGRLVAAGEGGSAVFRLPLPYVYVAGTLSARFEGGEGKLSLSTDGGKTWTPAAAGDVSSLVRQKYDVRVKAEFPKALTSLRLEAVVQHNRGALPYLVSGRNTVTISAGAPLPEGHVVSVTYAYQEATVPEGRRRWDGQGITYGPVTKATKTAERLPFTFTLDVGGNAPPKMLSLERAVRGDEGP